MATISVDLYLNEDKFYIDLMKRSASIPSIQKIDNYAEKWLRTQCDENVMELNRYHNQKAKEVLISYAVNRTNFETIHRKESTLNDCYTINDYSYENFPQNHKLEFLIALDHFKNCKGKQSLIKSIYKSTPKIREEEMLYYRKENLSNDEWSEILCLDIFKWLNDNIKVVEKWDGLTKKEVEIIKREIEEQIED